MTNADTINRELAEMEEKNGGECVHKSILVSTEKVPHKFRLLWRCDKCDIRRYGGKYGIEQFIPDRLSDGAYIGKQFIKLVKADYHMIYENNCFKIRHREGFGQTHDRGENKWWVVDAKDADPAHAIALAAIQQWKEGGG